MIRKALNEDIDKIKKMGKKFSINFDNEFNVDNYINDDIYQIYVDDNKGFIISTLIMNNVDVLLVYVDEDYRNQGIATKLLKEVEKGEKCYLEVSVENIPAYNLYLKNGYKVINVRKGYYHGIDAYIMEKVL